MFDADQVPDPRLDRVARATFDDPEVAKSRHPQRFWASRVRSARQWRRPILQTHPAGSLDGRYILLWLQRRTAA